MPCGGGGGGGDVPPSPEERFSPTTGISPEMDQRERWIEWVRVRERESERKRAKVIADLVAAACRPPRGRRRARRSPQPSFVVSIDHRCEF